MLPLDLGGSEFAQYPSLGRLISALTSSRTRTSCQTDGLWGLCKIYQAAEIFEMPMISVGHDGHDLRCFFLSKKRARPRDVATVCLWNPIVLMPNCSWRGCQQRLRNLPSSSDTLVATTNSCKTTCFKVLQETVNPRNSMIELLEAANCSIWDQLRHSAEELWLKSSESLR